MILYKALKYKLLDVALSILFDRIFFNVNNRPNRVFLEDLYEGQQLSIIENRGLIFKKCIIKKIVTFDDFYGSRKVLCYRVVFSHNSFAYKNDGVDDIDESGIESLYDYAHERFFDFYL